MKKTLFLFLDLAGLGLLFSFPVFAQGPGPEHGGLGNTPHDSGAIPTPRDWLNGFNPGGLFPTGGIDFVTGNIVPFVIAILLLLVVVLSFVFILIGGIMWTLSRGEKEGLAKAKATVTYAIIGLVLGLGSFIILGVVGNLLGFKFF